MLRNRGVWLVVALGCLGLGLLATAGSAPVRGERVAVAPAPGRAPVRAPRIPGRALGMGLAGPADWSTQFPFLDLAKSARHWVGNDGLTLDENGWIKDMGDGLPAELYVLSTRPASPPPYAEWAVRYKGKGRIDYMLAARQDRRRSRPGRDVIVIDPKSTYAVLKIRQIDAKDPLRDIAVVPLEHEQAYLRGEVWNPLFLERLSSFRALRFMDWMYTNNSTIRRWDERPRVEHASWVFSPRGAKQTQGVPLEIMIALANRVGADPWFNMPHLADDEYVERFANMVKQRLASHLLVYIEHSNEVWNFGFQQAHHANRSGRAMWGDHGNAYIQWHGMRTAEVCQIWKRAFGKQRDRVVCVLGLQAHYPGLAKPALECPLWRQGGKPCYRHGIDAIAIAAYVNGCLNGRVEEEPHDRSALVLGWVHGGDEGVTRAFEQVRDGRHMPCRETVKNMGEVFRHWAKVAKDHGLGLLAYEAGQHITGAGGPLAKNEDVVPFYIGLNRDARMQEIYSELLSSWKQHGGGLFMHFVDIDWPSRFGSWGALEYLTQPSSPKWRALTRFSAQGCWWRGC